MRRGGCNGGPLATEMELGTKAMAMEYVVKNFEVLVAHEESAAVI